jgi:mono/diheme cytochrome c family protein
MWKTNLKVLLLAAIVLGFYTMVARMIPQLESAVPAVLDLSAGVTPEILVPAGEALFVGAGACSACHGLGSRGPNLRTGHAGEGTIGQRCGNRKPGVDCKTYLYESMVQPDEYLVDGFTGIMPDARRQLSEEQIWAIVAYLQDQGGEVTVTASDIQGARPAAAPAAPVTFSAASDPMELLAQNACLGCHGINGISIPLGPSFDGMGSRLTADQIRRGILDPNEGIAEGFDQFAGIMPATFGQQMSAQQLEAMVQFLAGRR